MHLDLRYICVPMVLKGLNIQPYTFNYVAKSVSVQRIMIAQSYVPRACPNTVQTLQHTAYLYLKFHCFMFKKTIDKIVGYRFIVGYKTFQIVDVKNFCL